LRRRAWKPRGEIARRLRSRTRGFSPWRRGAPLDV